MKTKILTDLTQTPYRLFFPIGIIGALLGLSRMLLPYTTSNIYWHRELMITLFLFPVSVGFLFTAGPRFFASFPVTVIEMVSGVLLFTGMIVFSLLDLQIAFAITRIAMLTLLLVFLTIRFIKRRSGNPVFSPFLFLGPFSGLLGSIAILVWLFNGNMLFYQLGRSLFHHGMFWVLFFGVGIKFFPMLTLSVRGLGELSNYDKFVGASRPLWLTVASLLLVTFIIEGSGYVVTAMWARFVLVFFMAKEGWLLFRPSPRRGVYTFVLKGALWTVLIAHAIFPFFPEQRTDLYHVIFTAGFMLGTLIVMGRVSFSHERLSLEMEIRSKLAILGFGLVYAAMLVRVTAFMLPKSYVTHLHYAAAIAILGVLTLVGLFEWRFRVEKNAKKQRPVH